LKAILRDAKLLADDTKLDWNGVELADFVSRTARILGVAIRNQSGPALENVWNSMRKENRRAESRLANIITMVQESIPADEVEAESQIV